MLRATSISIAAIALIAGLRLNAQQASDVQSFLSPLILSGAINEDAIVEFLDLPEKTDGIGTSRTIEFQSGDDRLVFHGSGKVQLHPFPLPQLSQSAGDQRRAIAALVTSGDYLSAVTTALNCGDCQSEINRLLGRVQAIDVEQDLDVTGLARTLAMVEGASRLPATVSTSRLQVQIQRLRTRLLSTLAPVVSRLRNRATAKRATAALPKVRDLVERGHAEEAWAIIGPFIATPAIADELPRLAAISQNWFGAQLESAIATRQLPGLAAFIRHAETAPPGLLPIEVQRALRLKALEAGKQVLESMLPTGLSPDTPEGSRLIALAMDDVLSAADRETLSPLFPSTSIPYELTLTSESACGLAPAVLEKWVSSQIHPTAKQGPSGELSVTATMTCTIVDSVGPASALPSSYRVGMQQLANPDYARAQAQLDAARSELARILRDQAANPAVGAWAGAAQGLVKGLAEGRVSTAQERLLRTPPYIENPVSAPYSATKRTFTREATLKLQIRMKDLSSQFTDSREVSLSGSVSDDEITGAMATDEKGVSNREPMLPSARDLYPRVLALDDGDVRNALEEILQSALLSRSNDGSANKARRLGALLLAADVRFPSPALAPFEQTLVSLASAPLGELLNVEFPVVARAIEPGHPPSSASDTSRVATAAAAMKALVVIKHGGATGSGFFVGDGLVITNAHVIEKAARISVRTLDGEEFLAAVVLTDAERDLALLRVSGWQGDWLRLGDSANLSVGEEVIAVGNPLGLEGTVTRGIVSAKRRIANVSLIQIDAAISPGSSGGPLLNDAGEVVGVTSWKISGQRSSAESLGFAVSATEIRSAFAEFLSKRELR